MKFKSLPGMKIVLLSIALFIIIMFFMLFFVKPIGFERYIFSESGIFDVEIYVKIAKNGYKILDNFAMYPLWPLTINLISKLFSTLNYTLVSNLTAIILFFISLPFVYFSFEKSFKKETAVLLFLCYVFNPMSIFHAIGYSESLLCLEISIFMYIFTIFKTGNKKIYFLFFILGFGLGLTRPILIQFILSVFFTSILLYRIYFSEYRKNGFFGLHLTSVGMILGYLTFALYAWTKGFPFFASYKAESSWDRVIGLHWPVLFQPHSVGGSDNMRVWDMQGFWLPLIFFIIAIYKYFTPKWSGLQRAQFGWKIDDTLLWLSLFFSCSHSAIQFLTYDLFFSTARFIFAIPLFFYAMGRILELFDEKKLNYILFGYFIISFSFFIYWWTRYARGGWIG